jgi:hypothetical protein
VAPTTPLAVDDTVSLRQVAGGSSVNKWLMLAVRLAVVVLIYYFISRQVPLQNLRPLMVPALIAAFGIAVALNVMQAMLCTVRWRLMAAHVEAVPGFTRSFAAYMEGLFFNQALPSFIGGDAVRILRWRAFGVAVSDALLSVFRDRLFGAIGASSFTVLAAAILWNGPVEQYKVLTLLALGAAVTVACVVVLSLSQWSRLSALLSRVRGVGALVEKLAASELSRRQLAQALGVSLVAQLLPGISVLVIAVALGIDISVVLAIAITGAILLISMIPVSLAGWGVREAGFLVILVPLGATAESALMLGICFGLAGVCGALLGGLSIALGWSAPALSSGAQRMQ